MNYREKYIKNIETHGYFIESYGCERCGKTTQPSYSVHHIVYRSEKPNHKEMHNLKNLIWLCNVCHDWFHGKKDRREYLMQERDLYNLFDMYAK